MAEKLKSSGIEFKEEKAPGGGEVAAKSSGLVD